MRTRFRPFGLTPLALLEMTRAVPRPPRTALMPFTLNEPFDDFARERSLPDCAAAFLIRAGTWSARASRSGFVPSTMHAGFSSDPDQAVRALLAAGAVRRVKAGIRISESPCWTLVNARDVHRDTEREEAEAGRRRAKWRADKQRQREAGKAGRRERIEAGVSGMSTRESAHVHPENPQNPVKPQASGSDVQVDIPGTSTWTPGKPASDNQDQDQSGVNQSNARAREGLSPGTLASVTAGISGKLGRPVSDGEALRAAAEWRRRAEGAGRVIHDPVKFYATCIRRERALELILAPPLPPPPQEWLGAAPEPVPGWHPFEPDPNPFTDSCLRCGVRRANARHVTEKASTG